LWGGSILVRSHMGNPEKGGGKGKGQKGKGPPGKYAFKVLCADGLVSAVLGVGGKIKDQMQEESGCRLMMSARDEYFPGTYWRILVVYGPDPDSVLIVLSRILEKIVECGEVERGHMPQAEPDYLGKEEGEYILRGLVPTKHVTALIGSKGSHVQAIRKDTGSKVFIDNNPVADHSLLRIIGSSESLHMAIRAISEHLAPAADMPWFPEWSMVRNIIAEADWPSESDGLWRHPQRDRERSPRRQAHRDSGSWDNGAIAGSGASTGSAAPLSDVEAMAQAMVAILGEIPEDTLTQSHQISSHLPREKVSALIGKKGENVKLVRSQTGAKISFLGQRNDGGEETDLQELVLEGSLLSIYQAHALLMKRYHETERPPEPATDKEKIADLQSQLAELQAQLAEAKRPAAKGGKGGKKGK